LSTYSIKDLERLTGIKAHTIRIWEQRYNLLSPNRSETNIRSYSNEELKHLLNVSLLNKYGVKISKIAEMDPQHIAHEAATILVAETDHEDLINGMINAMIDLDENLFDSVMDNATNRFGFAEAVIHVVYPFMNRIGIMWQTGTINPAQEHFVSNLIRQKFIVAINSIRVEKQRIPHSYILFLPENELHELVLLFYHFMIKHAGAKAFYLGQSVPFDDLSRVVEISQADRIITCITNRPMYTAKEYLTNLSNAFPHLTIYAFGGVIVEEKITSFANVVIPDAPDQLIRIINDPTN
jgi:DNA-binding transcriptional MerR regulator